MSGLYLLVVIAVWVGLSALLWKAWRRWRIAEGGSRRARDALALAIAVLWCSSSFWYAGGQNVYYDMEVNRRCAKDGGIKVYETVRLPAEKFNQWGQPNFYKPTQHENALGPEYVFRWDLQDIRKGNPSLRRSHTQVFRRSDSKLLGEVIDYSRGGGDLPGPWQPSSFTCPEAAGHIELLTRIFVKSDKG